jgi:hypothetical protein
LLFLSVRGKVRQREKNKRLKDYASLNIAQQKQESINRLRIILRSLWLGFHKGKAQPAKVGWVFSFYIQKSILGMQGLSDIPRRGISTIKYIIFLNYGCDFGVRVYNKCNLHPKPKES